MTREELLIVTQHLQNYKNITSLGRVDDTVIKIVFDRDEVLYFDMKKGDSYVFKKDDFKRSKVYNAPFDVILYKRLGRSSIESLEVLEGNRVLQITVNSNSSYKAEKSILQFEFTGRNTNAIILDENKIVLEALRHIDESVSYRSIKVGEPLEPLPPYELKKRSSSIENLNEYLMREYQKRADIKLTQMKNQKMIFLQKKINKLQKLLAGLHNENELLAQSKELTFWGTLVLSNISEVKAYQKIVKLKGFDGEDVEIIMPKEARSASESANILFTSAKKLKRKAKSLYIEKQNLNEKIKFLQNMQNVISKAEDESEINILLPKQKKQKKAKKERHNFESFFMEGFKIMLGKNEKGNIELLQDAKKRDIWLHVKDIPSSHVIIRTDKQNIPQNVIEFGAKLCVDFSTTSQGVYLVDYTPRRNVKVKDGANVNYVDYKTLHVKV